MRAAAVAIILSCIACATPAGATDGVHLAWGSDASTEVTVTWSEPEGVAASWVEYGPGLALRQDGERIDVPDDDRDAWRARLVGLLPGTDYPYRVRSATDVSRESVISTAPRTTATFSISAWGDHGTPSSPRADGDAPTRVSAAAGSLDAAFNLVLGDISYADDASGLWENYLDQVEPFAARRPLMTSVGNHEWEEDGFSQYDAWFNMPSNDGRWYSFRYANAVFVALDSEAACIGENSTAEPAPFDRTTCPGDVNGVQLEFLEQTLSTARLDPSVEWIVVFLHYPVYSAGPHGSNLALRELWAPVWERHGVDLVLTAHDHLYSRTQPLRAGNLTRGGTTYLTVGTGGSELYTFASAPYSWEAARVAGHHGLLHLTFGDGDIRGEFRTPEGAVLDSFRLDTSSPGPGHPLSLDVIALLPAVLVAFWAHRRGHGPRPESG